MDVSKRQQLAWEKELLGAYVSDHPVASKMDILGSLISHYNSETPDVSQDKLVIVAGEVTQICTILTRRDKQMAFVSLEDLRGEIELIIFPKLWADVSEWMEEGLIVVAKGKVDTERGNPKVLVDKITDNIERVKVVSNTPAKEEKEA